MINTECARTSAVSEYSSNWLFRTGQSNYILNLMNNAMESFGFADNIIIV